MGAHPAFSSSFILQVCLYFDQFFSLFYFVLGILTYIYKPIALPFPSSVLGGEAVGFSFFCVLTVFRLLLGHKGNLTQNRFLVLFFLFLCCPALFGFVFFLKLQTFILRVDQIVNVIGIIFVAVEMVLAIITAAQMSQKQAI